MQGGGVSLRLDSSNLLNSTRHRATVPSRDPVVIYRKPPSRLCAMQFTTSLWTKIDSDSGWSIEVIDLDPDPDPDPGEGEGEGLEFEPKTSKDALME